MTYTATYSPDDNKLRLYAVSRLDPDTYARVKRAGFIWAPKQQLFVAPMWTPAREDLLLDLAGEIGDDDTSLLARAEDRSERFEEYHENRARDASRAQSAVSAIADNIPLGQPILVGHHSERRARKDAERIENGMRKALKMWRTSEYWKHRAAGAIHHAKYKERPDVRARRIKTIEADKRKQERAIAECRKWLRAWAKLTAPEKGAELRPGVVAMDAPPASPEVQLKRATFIANYSGLRLPDGDPRGWSMWSALNDGKMTPREACLLACKHYGRCIAYAQRWTAHYTNRLTYETAMLADQGASELIAPKPRAKGKTAFPICNYRAPGGIAVENIYHRGEMVHYPQIELTSAEYASINTDYKSTRVVGNSHRVRTAMQNACPRHHGTGHGLVCVFLTDSKAHERPADVEPAPRERPAQRPFVPREKTEAERQIEALQQGIKAGVTTVSAPCLFPTPRAVAEQVIELADIREGDRVLEPSAGMGALASIVATRTRGSLLCIERNAALAQGLSRAGYVCECADFLEWNGALTSPSLQFDRIVMNPPFDHGSDIKHVQHARRMLAPNGRLVAIVANGPRQRDTFEPIAREWIDLPAGTFAGTDVRTAIVVLDDEEADETTAGARAAITE